MPRSFRLLLTTSLLLPAFGLGCSDDQAAAEKSQQPAASLEAKKTLTPVRGARLLGEALDKDGDGKVETWHKHDAAGNLVIATDTDGDGVADVFSTVKADSELPPGFRVEGGNKTEALKSLGPEPPK